MSYNRRALNSLLPLLLVWVASHARAENSTPKVTDVPEGLRREAELDPFYKKYVSAGGLPVLSTNKVSDEALLEAVYRIQQMLGERSTGNPPAETYFL